MEWLEKLLANCHPGVKERVAQLDHAGLDPAFMIVLSWSRTGWRALSTITE
jgi:hypothetical protein